MSLKLNGVPPAAGIGAIVGSLFQNEKIGSIDVLFSRVHLSVEQKELLLGGYPEGMVPIGFYILYQTKKNDVEGDSVLLSSQLVSFVEKNDGFVYGCYFNLVGLGAIPNDVLTRSRESIVIDGNVEFVASNYLEVYHDVVGTVVILGLGSGASGYASLQYTHGSKYYYEQLGANGIADPNYPVTCLVGVSKNLRCVA